MIRKQKIEDSPEFRYFEEHFDEMMEEMEKDSESQSFEIPEEWDRSFRKTIEETVEREEKKKSRKEKLLRWGSRAVAAAAGIALVMFIGMNFSAVQVQGEGLLDVFQKMFDMNGNKHTTFSVGEEVEMSEDEELHEVYFEASTLGDAYEKLREELKMPMFYITYIPEEFGVEKVTYNEMYNILNIQLKRDKNTIFISQQQQFDEVTTGILNEAKKCAEIKNDKINQTIKVYGSVQDESFAFCIELNHMMLVVNCNISLEEVEKIVESIEFR